MKTKYLYAQTVLCLFLILFMSASLYAQTDTTEIPEEHMHDEESDNCGVDFGVPATSGANLKTAKIIIPFRFTWPLRQKAGVNNPGFWAISQYIDHDPAVDTVLDYNGGTDTYDGHRGTDIRIYPYAWKKVKESEVEVIAAADGEIISITDGNMHEHCGPGSSGGSNTIRIRHDLGIITIYGHMKKNSLTWKKVGDRVVKGEYLGIVASSGHSSLPHLHFEVQDGYGNLIDPWKGPSNTTYTESLWEDQLPYQPSGLNYIAITSDKTESTTPNCPDVENTYEKNDFFRGDDIWFNIMLRSEKGGQRINYSVYKPDGTVWQRWNTQATEYSTYNRRSKKFTIPSSAPFGEWKIEVIYLNKLYIKTFNVVLKDCNGVTGGSAYIDECFNCVGGNTGRTTSDVDQDGISDCIDHCPQDANKSNQYQGNCSCVTCIDICFNVPDYDGNEFYSPGDVVKYLGKRYRCKRHVLARRPGVGLGSPWEYLGLCSRKLDLQLPSFLRTVEASPNPAKNELTLHLTNIEEPVSIQVYNYMGQELCSFPKQQYGESFTFPVDKLPSGFLLIKINGDEFSETIRVKKE